MKYLYLLLLCVAIAPAPADAQVPPPDFICVISAMGRDSLVWTNVANNCGPFEATEIYRSTSADGPFTLLAEITAPSQTSFADNVGATTYYYLLRYRYACPGEMTEDSRIIRAGIPDPPQIEYVTVTDGQLTVVWQPSASSQVVEYTVEEDLGNDIIEVGTTGTTSLTLDAGPDPAGRSFFISSRDACGSGGTRSLPAAPSNLSLRGGVDCDQNVVATIDQASLRGVVPISLELFVSVDGGAFVGQGTVDPASDTITYREANDGENLCFYYEAALNTAGRRVRSVTRCLDVAIVPAARPFRLFGVERLPAGGFRFQFADGALDQAVATRQLEFSSEGGQVFILSEDDFALDGTDALTVPGLTPAPAPTDLFRIRSVGTCGEEEVTNEARYPELSAELLAAGQVALNWTPLTNNLSGELFYDVFRRAEDGSLVPIQLLIPGTSASVDFDSEAGPSQCFIVRASFSPNPPAARNTYEFLTNEVCVSPEATLFIPNVFSPTSQQGANRAFRVFFSTPPTDAGFRMLVYDRWGGLVFETQDFDEAWDGRIGAGEEAAVGTYMYVVEYVPRGGEVVVRSGVVTLLR